MEKTSVMKGRFAAGQLAELALTTIKELDCEFGILASSKSEIFGCVFGRDSAITGLQLLEAYQISHDPYLLELVKKIIANLFLLLGKEHNIESGEQPGKAIHEYRLADHEHLTKALERPWYVYPDGAMRIYDSVDATPLLLWLVYRYWQQSGDEALLDLILPNVRLSLAWLKTMADSNGDGFIDYQINPERKSGGLVVQNWMDSQESLFHEDGQPVQFPIAPVEAQAYTFIALRLWANYFSSKDTDFSQTLFYHANTLKQKFAEKFVIYDEQGPFLAAGIDGSDRPLRSVRSSMGHCLWASLSMQQDGIVESIIPQEIVPAVVSKLLSPEMFEPHAGIRTLSKRSVRFSANSYHNGSIWPHDTALIAAGLENHGFTESATAVRLALRNAYIHFGTPLELFVCENKSLKQYRSPSGQTACQKQAWSAAALLALSLTNQQHTL